ncbi:beta-N-acetylhexosaminidase [Vibrio breoganii]|uniref:beta-N-acetylhexosaminidase n=1 Tax=Vibrio breoganii TaxID=553239 RepID=UPI000C82D51E|nr:beta-N-acetylhexosaminidase [Vibrio breoganii]PMO70377.1 beta-N-acetylhexosaminidase [Vibrio breoganii]PMO84117.1 beta-N-acetylhexosaminidase [Vibrio breoganii]
MLKKSLIATSVITVLAGCSSMQNSPQNTVDLLANNLDIKYEVLTNHGADEGLKCQDLGAEWASCNQVKMTLTNDGEAVDSNDWTIYFHSIRLILDVDNEQFKITRVTGDLHKLEPTDKFEGFKAGESVDLTFIGEYWQLFETDFMPGAFVAADGAEPKQIVSLSDVDMTDFVSGLEGDNLKRTAGDNNIIATAASRFDKNSDVALEDVTTAIIPAPSFSQAKEGSLDISGGLKLENAPFEDAQVQALESRAELLGVNLAGTTPVQIAITPEEFKAEHAKSGAYSLNIEQDGIEIKAFDNAGAFYAMQSVFALVNLDAPTELPQVEIKDAPRFDYRGVMVDVARNFHTKEAILSTIDQLAAYKMNKLHLHLTDDEGWRLEIPGLPELTEIGAKRCFDLDEKSCLLPQLGSGSTTENFGTGHFTRADYLEILKYAKARNVEVIPEIDMPAHARAAVVSMEARYDRLMAEGNEEAANEYRLMDPQDTSNVTTIQFYDKQSFINPCIDSSKRFVDKIITEVAAMHNEAGMPLTTWHFGGDEAKNIKLGAGFQDINAEEKVAWKGNIDLSEQDLPFAKSPQCQALIQSGDVEEFGHLPSYFAEEVSKIVAQKGIANFQAWEDGLKYSEGADSFATENTRVNFWETLYWGGAATVYEWANKGYDIVASNPDYVYMDFPYEVDPKERGYYWATRATDTRKMFAFAPENMPQNAETSVDRDGNGFTAAGTVEQERPFYGMSAQLWSETVRTDEQFEYMVFPRVVAAAERAWHAAEWENEYKVGVEYSQDTDLVNKDALLADWTRFANVMGQRELAKIEKAGIDYRLPIPGAEIVDGKLAMNVQFPGVELQYSVDGEKWVTYQDEQRPSVSGDVWIKSVSASGERESRLTQVK